MPQNDLTTLANVRAWLGSTTTASDPLISQEISRLSSVILGWLGERSLLSQTYTELRDGKGNDSMTLARRPVTNVTSLTVLGTAIPQNTTGWANGAGGWTLDPWDGLPPATYQRLVLIPGASVSQVLGSYYFPRIKQSVSIVYTAGYLQQNEPWTVPAAPYQVTPLQPYGLIAKDAGVTYADGTPLTAIASGTPSVGEYVPPNPLAAVDSPIMYYQFAAADAGQSVLISYSYVPFVIENAVCEQVAERMRYRLRIGEDSKILGGQETLKYQSNALPKILQDTLMPYRNVVPVR